MKVSNLFGERLKERPADAHIESHALMVRGGYIRQVTSGIYSYYTPMVRISSKIERILREEMERIGGQEVKFPVVLSADLWKESGRYESVDDILVRFSDRNGHEMVLGMTHEEAAVHLANQVASSYAQYPFMIYQIQTKFRDERRSRGGLMRVREFTMKDGYSFHTSKEDMEEYYTEVYDAYHRIYARCGAPEVLSVYSDPGMMGGSVAHEYMYLSPVGEDSVVLCSNCDYRSNMEVAETILAKQDTVEETLTLVETPDATTIEDVVNFFGASEENLCKAVVYQQESDDRYVVVFLRGDLELNETKLNNLLRDQVYPAPDIDPSTGIIPGYIGPHGLELSEDTIIVYDRSLEHTNNLVCGANKEGHHYKGFSLLRDAETFAGTFHDVSETVEGAICPECGKETITIKAGIEVGHIFQLGDRYTKSMNMQYTDQNDDLHHPLMGCYGIGVGRLAASIAEEHRDEYGPIWPISIAPWQVHICALRADDEQVAEVSNALYKGLQKRGVEVIFDDRDVRAGAMFSDADLLGVPVRVVVSPRNLKENAVEVTTRDKSFDQMVAVDQAEDFIQNFVEELLEDYR